MIILAFFIGFLFSIPLGPLGQIILKRSVEQGFWQGFSIVFIDAAIVSVINFLLLFRAGMVGLNPTLRLVIQSTGLLFFFFIGIKEILYSSKNKIADKKIPTSKYKMIEKVLLVLGYHVANPVSWVFWINLTRFVFQFQIIEKNPEQYFLFSILYGVGLLFCQYLVIVLVRNIASIKKVKSSMKYLVSGSFIIMFGYFLYVTIIDLSQIMQ